MDFRKKIGVVVDAGHGGICLTQSNERMTTNIINIKKLRYFDWRVSFIYKN